MYKTMSRLLLMWILFAAFAVSVSRVDAQQNPKLPVPPGAINVVTAPGSLTYTTGMSVKEAAKFYTDHFTSIGFTVTSNLVSDVAAAVQYVGPKKQVVNLVIGKDNGGTGIVISYTGDFDVSAGGNNANPGTTNADNTANTTAKYQSVTMPLNIELLFDASGSMADALGTSTRIAAARQTVGYITNTLQRDANVHVGMRVFGQAGDNTDAGRAKSCASTELLVPIKSDTGTQLVSAAAAYKPTGWTPIALALNEAAADFTPDMAANARNVIILVSDGEETCGGDPAAVASLLYKSKAKITTHVVAIAANEKTAPVLSKIAAKGGGVFLNVTDVTELAGSVLGLISSEVSNAGGTLVIPDSVSSELTVKGQGGSITFTDGQINIGTLVKSSAKIGQVSIEGSAARLNVKVGGTSIDINGINSSVTIQDDGDTVTVDGSSGSVTVGDSDGSVSVGPDGIKINPKITETPEKDGE
jgi:hypothetical protein